MHRRALLEALLALWPFGQRVLDPRRPAGGAAWSDSAAFDAFARRMGRRLLKVESPLEACARQGGRGADALFASLKNPYRLGDDPALTQTLGWTGAWTLQASSYAVRAESAADVAAAVDFARSQKVRLVVKGGGHSYLGNSNAADSLLVWTRALDRVDLHPGFVAAGAPAGTPPRPAVSVGAGALWGRVYQKVAVEHGRYVQGGGCLTVGVSGFVLGGGFGSLSKAFGTGAANLLEAEVVTADGRVRLTNRWRDPDLFFALRGGGGGTFAVATRLTLATHPLPSTIGAVMFTATALSDEGWRRLVDRVLAFYADALFNPAWGEQIRFEPGRRLRVSMVCHGLDRDRITEVWRPFFEWIAERGDECRLDEAPVIVTLPGRTFWDPATLRSLPAVVLADDRPGAPAGNIFWTGNLGEAGQVLHAYESMWLPASLLDADHRRELAAALVTASSVWPLTLHTNKGMAGGAPEARAACRETAMNPEVVDAFALVICAADGTPGWPGIPGHEPDAVRGARQSASVSRAMVPMRALAPGAGSYVSETSYFDRDWQTMYWGTNYARLAAIKRTYDADDLLTGHHTVRPA